MFGRPTFLPQFQRYALVEAFRVVPWWTDVLEYNVWFGPGLLVLLKFQLGGRDSGEVWWRVFLCRLRVTEPLERAVFPLVP